MLPSGQSNTRHFSKGVEMLRFKGGGGRGRPTHREERPEDRRHQTYGSRAAPGLQCTHPAQVPPPAVGSRHCLPRSAQALRYPALQKEGARGSRARSAPSKANCLSEQKARPSLGICGRRLPYPKVPLPLGDGYWWEDIKSGQMS